MTRTCDCLLCNLITITLSALQTLRGPGSSVGIATGYGLDSLWMESWWGHDFPHLSNRSWGPPSLLYNRYWVFPGLKSSRGVTLTLTPFSCHGHKRVQLYLYTTYGAYGLYRGSVPVQGCTLPYLSACTRVHFTLPQCLYKGALYLYLSACTRVHFTLPQCLYKGALYLTSVPVQG